MNITDSVLTSIKKLLGIAEEYDSYELSNPVQYCWLYVDDKIYQRN